MADEDALTQAIDRHIRASGRLTARMLRSPESKNMWTGLTKAQMNARDSMDHRARALFWHVRILEARFRNLVESSNKDFEAVTRAESSPMHGIHAHIELSYMLDDVVFNAVALLDHTCALLPCLFRDPHKRTTWSRTVKRIKSGKSPYPRPLCQLLRSTSDEWVRGLDTYRSEQIHRELHVGDGRQLLHVEKPRIEYWFFLPDALVRGVASILPPAGESGVELVEGATSIGARCVGLSAEVVEMATDLLCNPRRTEPSTSTGA